MKNILQDLSFDEIVVVMQKYSQPKYRAEQVYQGLMHGNCISSIPTISKELKQLLLNDFEDAPLSIIKSIVGKDQTTKFLFKLSDNNIIEGVLLKYKYGYTLCISTQVGCRMGCKFCASTLNGLVRNLTCGEMLMQVVSANKHLSGGLGDKRKITNIVLMGSGEPFDNYENVTKFFKLVGDERGLGISQRNISVSTCGLCESMQKLADDGFAVTLTISLHAPTDEIRRQTMPIANLYTIDQIIKSANYYFNKTGRRIIFEYALIKDVNDSFECAKILSEKFKNLTCHFNIIPLNDVEERNLEGAGRKRAYAFAQKLTDLGMSATVRRTMGEDVGGACGQLRNSYID